MTILLVEDDPGIGRFIHRGLTAEGYGVEWERSGRRALTRLSSGLFQAAILDLGLPDMDGTDLCRELRRDGIDLPVCMLTARANLDDKLEGFRCGADDYLTKPFSFEELLARLAVMLRRSDTRSQERLQIGTLMLDIKARTAKIDGKAMELTPREFDLLQCLARKAGQAVSRGEILDNAWGADADVTENAVDVYMGYLRKRFSQHRSAPVLATIRGVGFSLYHGTKA